ncbi:pheromone processing endoprotease [Agyrium rufum]|nr:pheromone processing endoprotease [Agyrium rufum]
MRLYTAWALLAFSACAFAEKSRQKDYGKNDYYTLHLAPGTPAEQVAMAMGLNVEGPVGELADHYLFSISKSIAHNIDETLHSLKISRRKRDASQGGPLDYVLWSSRSKLRPRMKKRSVVQPLIEKRGPYPALDVGRDGPADNAAIIQRQEIARELQIRDPIFAEQWHLYNTIQVGNDINVTGVWMQGITGKNTTAVVVDDGLDMYSDDLKANYFAEGSYDFNDQTDEPRPRLSDDNHGTRCAGEIAAVRNDVCGVGIAYDARIAGIRILSKMISDADEAAAINYKMQLNQIYSCSWGPPDDGKAMEVPGMLIERALVNGVQNGRGGKGSVFVYAAGNGAASGDNCNFDGYTNSIYSITVGAIDRQDLHPYYSESCSAQMVVTYSSGGGSFIHTTGVGKNHCYPGHGGTSAAAPIGAGVFALALEVRPELTWRDMQTLCWMTAVPVNLDASDWVDTYAGKKFSHDFGYGKLDAWALVEKAKTMALVKPQAWYISPWQHVKHTIPQGSQGLSTSFEVTEEYLKKANFEKVEHVTVTMNIEHTLRGDLSVELISPEGITSHLSVARKNDDFVGGYDDWTFMTVAHWGEPGIGNWTLIVKDTVINENNGSLIDWKLNIWGECLDASIQGLRPMPTEHDDDDHDMVLSTVGTTSVSLPASTNLPAEPSDHISRPVPVKSTSTPSTATTALQATPTPSSIASTISSALAPTGTAFTGEGASESSDSFLPHYFPTFGVSKRTQIWIYGALTLIILFCLGLGISYWIVRRRRQALASRGDYEFEVLEDHEPDDQGRGAGRRSKRRAGELYDAFAGESEEELFSEAEDDGPEYRDEKPSKKVGRDTGEEEGDEMSEK